MTREEFIKRLEEVGFELLLSYHYYWEHLKLSVRVPQNMDIFVCKDKAYSFDELEQFLIDKGIVEEPFDAHEYLLSKRLELESAGEYHHAIYGNYLLSCSSSTLAVTFVDTQDIGIMRKDSKFYFNEVSKQSIDKAIKLIEFLNELEKE